MQTVKLIIEFEGTDFHGWQFQPNLRTVQGVLSEKLLEICGEVRRLRSSSRTDAGVHARRMPVVFESERDLPMKAYLRGLNSALPPDVKVREANVVAADYNPRAEAHGVGGFQELAAPCRRPQGTTPQSIKLEKT